MRLRADQRCTEEQIGLIQVLGARGGPNEIFQNQDRRVRSLSLDQPLGIRKLRVVPLQRTDGRTGVLGQGNL